jgi:2'-5' RNA ligase
MTDTALAHITLKATGKFDTAHAKHFQEWRFNLLNSAEREAFFLALEDYVLQIASEERKAVLPEEMK